jgi:hypothetical protein
VPHFHVNLNTIAACIKKWGSKFKDLYKSFKSAFSGFRFRLPFVKMGRKIRDGFKKGISAIRGLLTTEVKAKPGRRLLADSTALAKTGQQWMPPGPGGAYAIVKLSEKLVARAVTAFCRIVQLFTNPLKNMFNGLMKLATGFLPKWLIKIVMFGGLGAIIQHFLFKAFCVEGTFTISYPFLGTVAEDSFAAGFALEFTDLQIGKTGCYLGGSSGIAGGQLGPSFEVGFNLDAFKHYGNIAGDSLTVGATIDLCKIFHLPCSLSIGGGIIFDNGKGVAKNVAKKCLKIFTGGQETQALELLEMPSYGGVTLEMLQTMSEEELEGSILSAAKKFFVDGFGRIKDCLVSIFNMWIGLTIGFDAGAKVSLPATGSFTFDYAWSTDGSDTWKKTKAPTAVPKTPATDNTSPTPPKTPAPAPSLSGLLLLRGSMTQSGTYRSGTAKKAMDGNKNQDYHKGHCTHTAGRNPWWKVDFARKMFVHSVKVWNRQDCCSNRLRGLSVFVGNNKCGVLGAAPKENLRCKMTGSFVKISRDYKEPFSLCEVEIWGSPVATSAPVAPVTSSPTSPRSAAVRYVTWPDKCSSKGYRDMTAAECKAHATGPGVEYWGKAHNADEAGCVQWNKHTGSDMNRPAQEWEFLEPQENDTSLACPKEAVRCACISK